MFKGNGVIRDFPGNYSQYREWQALQPRDAAPAKKATATSSAVSTTPPPSSNKPRKLSFKEKRELEQLEKDITSLEAEKKQIEEALSSGAISVDEITRLSKRLPLLDDELDVKSMRWLELSEIADNKS